MITIIDHYNTTGGHTLLTMDSDFPQREFTTLLIDGKSYTPIPVFDVQRTIGIDFVEESLTGKVVEFI